MKLYMYDLLVKIYSSVETDGLGLSGKSESIER